MLNTDGRHDAIQEFRDAFEFDHLPEGLPQTVCAVFHDAAAALLAALPDGPALTRSIHDVWRAKNEAVRFAVRIRTEGHAGRPAAVFRGSEPAHETMPVERTELRPLDHAPGRERWQGSAEQLAQVKAGKGPDEPRAANPFESTALGDTDRVLFPDVEPDVTPPGQPPRSGLTIVTDDGRELDGQAGRSALAGRPMPDTPQG